MREIKGVVSIKSKSIRSFNIKLDAKFTNGHDYCELIIDENANSFTARLYGKEVYSYSWGAPGDDFIMFLINVLAADDGYLYSKLADYSKENYVDMDKTVIAMKNQVLEYRRKDASINEGVARQAFDHAEDLSGHGDVHIETFYAIFEEPGIEDILSLEDGSFIIRKDDHKCRVFCSKVAPILANVLRSEYNK